jgi:hypothetical protein
LLILPIVGAAFLACQSVSAPVSDVDDPNLAKGGGGVVESVTGSFHRTWTHPRAGWTAWRTLSFNARKKDGSVEGRFQLNNHGQSWMKGVVTCFTIVGNEAWVGVTVEESNNPIFVGGERGMRVLDGGEGRKAPLDRASSLSSSFSAQQLCDETPDFPMRDLQAGNIQVRGGGIIE